MRKLLGILGLADVVWTQDHDGEIRLRIAQHTNNGVLVSGQYESLGKRGVLLPDGTIKPLPLGSYLGKWKPFRVREGFTSKLIEPKDIWDTL